MPLINQECPDHLHIFVEPRSSHAFPNMSASGLESPPTPPHFILSEMNDEFISKALQWDPVELQTMDQIGFGVSGGLRAYF